MSTGKEIIEGRFIRRVLADAANDIIKNQRQAMSNRGFKSADWFTSTHTVANTTMELNHIAKSRFVDMKFRTSKDGRKRRKNHPIHNKIIWGQYNEIIKQLHYGFTKAVKAEMLNLIE